MESYDFETAQVLETMNDGVERKATVVTYERGSESHKQTLTQRTTAMITTTLTCWGSRGL